MPTHMKTGKLILGLLTCWMFTIEKVSVAISSNLSVYWFYDLKKKIK